MGIPVWVTGQVLTASDVNNWFVPNAVTKSADQSVTSSTTLQNDAALFLPVLANASYNMTCFLDFEGGAIGAGDLKLQWTIPSGNMRWVALYDTTAPAVSVATTKLASVTIVAASNGAGVLQAMTMLGSIIVGSTGGNLQLQWAQNTSNATATIVHAMSFLSLQRTN